MKNALPLLCLVLAGCQTAVPAPPPAPTKPAPEPRPVAVTPIDPNPALAQKVRHQAQYIDALISQNEALAAKLVGANAPVAFAPAAQIAGTTVNPPPAPSAAESVPEMLAPNADGVIDLTAAIADAQAAENVNPFAVRSAIAGPAREVVVQVSGIMAGKTPCAVINDRLVQVNDVVDALTVERIGADWVGFRFSGQRLRVPVSDQAVKVKLPL